METTNAPENKAAELLATVDLAKKRIADRVAELKRIISEARAELKLYPGHRERKATAKRGPGRPRGSKNRAEAAGA